MKPPSLLTLATVLVTNLAPIFSADALTVPMDGAIQSVPSLPSRQWAFYCIEVPAQIGSEDVLGWELRVKDWSGGEPQLVVRRDLQPDRFGNRSSTGSSLFPAGSFATFASGQQHSSDEDQWTGRSPVRNTSDTEDIVLTLAMGNPLEPGTYYVGIYNDDSSDDCAFTFQSRAIGDGMSLDITEIAPGSDAIASGIAPREPVYFRYTLPAPVPAWRFELDFGAASPDGEGMLVLRKDFVPNSQRDDDPYDAPFTIDTRADGTTTYQTELEIQGGERVTILPASGESMVPAGTYYAMVVAEGNSPTSTSTIGDGNVDLELWNTTAPLLETLGVIPFESQVTRNENLQAGENRFFHFSVPENSAALRISLVNLSGTPVVALRTSDNELPYYSGTQYGLAGGQSNQADIYRSGTINLGNPAAGDYALLIRSASSSSCSYQLEIETLNADSVAFDGGSTTTSTLGPQRWKYYRIDVPAQVGGQDVLGWELRARDWTGGDPEVVVRRDLPPTQVGTRSSTGSNLSFSGSRTVFLSGQQHGSDEDQWTERDNTANGAPDTEDRVLTLAMGNPLEPGTYYIGIYNSDISEDCAFTIQSRAIGPAMSLDITEATLGADVTISGLAPREPAFFRYTLASAVPSWRFELALGATSPDGEGMLVLRKDFVPNSQRDDDANDAPYTIDTRGGGTTTYQTELGIAGPEFTTVLPASGESMIPAGTYYAMIVAEGNSPSSTSRIGNGNVDLVLGNETPQPVGDLGSFANSSMLEDTSSVPQGGTKFYRFEVTNSDWPLEFRLEGLNSTNSRAFLRTSDDQLPKPSSSYGVVGGASPDHSFSSGTVFTLANPPLGHHTLVIQPQPTTTAAADFEITITRMAPVPIGFSSLQSGGPSNTGSIDLENGQYGFYRVEIPESVAGQEFLGWQLVVETTTGSVLTSVTPESPPISLDPPFGFLSGNNGHFYLGDPFPIFFGNSSVDLLPAPWIVQLRATGNAAGTLTSEAIFASILNMDASINAAGGSHTDSDQLAAGEKKFYRIEVPATVDGEAVLGWNLQLDATIGNASLRVSPDQLPINWNAVVYQGSNSNLLLDGAQAPPGTYYVEVNGDSATEFTLASSAITAADIRQTWTMPARGEIPNTPGLSAPLFGDSGIGSSGNPLPGDLGTDLPAGQTHFFAMEVPEGNEGILVAQLDAIAGNPDLYIRRGALATESFDYSLQQDTDYGHWVAADGFTSKKLPAGTYFLSVRNPDSSPARYRLRLSTGNIQHLDIDGGSVSNQAISDGEWRYFRVEIPLDLPEQWQLVVSAPQRDVSVYLRDSVPPGPISNGSITSWRDERKNQGSYNDYSTPVTLDLSAPQLRPGHTYYIGLEARSDSTFSLSSQISGGTRSDPPVLDFYSGAVTDTLASGEKRFYRVPVPTGSVRLKYSAVHSNAVSIYLEQGSFPSETSADDFRRVNSNGSSLSRLLYTTADEWPWVVGESYYFSIVNTGATSEAFTLTMNGKTVFTDDEDEDGMPDQWERDTLGTTAFRATDDPRDEDGIPLLLEYFFALDPETPDHPDITPSRIGEEFLLDFRKTAQTPLLRQRVTSSQDLLTPAESWTDASATFELLSDDGPSQLWRARVTVDPEDDHEFFRIAVDEAPAP